MEEKLDKIEKCNLHEMEVDHVGVHTSHCCVIHGCKLHEMEVDHVGVHTSHCCVIHGCKYGDDDCPVETLKHPQQFICEQCSNEGRGRRSVPNFTIPIKDEGKRWEEGIEHDFRSKRILEILDAADPDLYFDWRTGGDGDNGEILMFQLDVYFEKIDRGVIKPPEKPYKI